jgi:hypothetical protein
MGKAVEHLWGIPCHKTRRNDFRHEAKIKEKIQSLNLKVVVARRGAYLHGIVFIRVSRELIRLGQSEP